MLGERGAGLRRQPVVGYEHVGLPELGGKEPATIAVSVAAALLLAFDTSSAAVREGA